ncbi:TonB-dependent receptor domain-containing protein [Thermomonas sp.]|uniref:TonB-dependent receptor n=1 Tax=Thermomonas sp. TaxID=1971895 RepID=UPI0035B1008F
MTNKTIHRTRRKALTLALLLCAAGGVQAQTNTAGAVTGRATSGDTITISNPATGFSRTITVGADGSYRFSQLPTGQYQISRNGAAPRNVTVNVGSAANIDFAGGDATTLDTVTVVGTGAINPIDVSSVESTTILTAEQIAKIPVARDTTSVALLAPGTVRGDAAFGNLASFGGSSVAENQYYFNGFNITNTFANLNFAQVPFEAIAEQQVKTGGYGAEFGRSTGGVINQISKRGTNEFHAGGSIFWSPDSLTEALPSPYSNDGVLLADNSRNTGGDNLTAAVWASGALVKDRLFAYGLVEYAKLDNDTFAGKGQANSTSAQNKQPKWLLKMDWNISDNHILEFTALSDKRKIETDYFDTLTDADDKSNPRFGTYRGTDYSEFGGEAYIAKYTGYLTDNFTLSVLAGHSESARSNYSITAAGIRNEYNGGVGQPASGCPVIVDARPSAVSGLITPRTGCTLANLLGRPDAKDSRDQYRIDLEWQLGDHLIRGGVDIDNFESVAGQSFSGGVTWRYGNYPATGIAGENSVVRKRVFQTGATVAVDQRAYYLEDSWSITDNFVAYLGLRWDTFDNKNGAGQSYVKIDNQFAPRLGFSWDVFGDSTFKVFGNAGRYALPLTATVAVRGASASLFSEQFYRYTGVDPVTGAPTGLTLINNPANGRPIRYLNNEFGVAKDPASIASQNLKPMYQDEYILGFQKQLTDNFSLGVRAIHRDLKQAIDDTCDYRPLIAAGLEQGFTADGGIFIEPADKTKPSDMAIYNPGFAFCHMYNPGEDGIFNVDFNGDGVLEQVTIPADVLGPKAKRKYTALEIFWEGNWDRWFLQGSYTFAKSIGNTEGGVKSDIGQADTSVTQDFDYPELMIGSYGYLPNDRRHSLKMFGNYEINDEWSVGANYIVQSGRPINCFGFLGGAATSHYGNGYFSCDSSTTFEPRWLDGGPDGNLGTTGDNTPNPNYDGGANNGRTIVPRGTAGRLPWTQTLDLNVAYKPAWAKGLQFKVDVFNVLNADKAVTVVEQGESASGAPQPTIYKVPTGWQTPRSVRFMVQYDF